MPRARGLTSAGSKRPTASRPIKRVQGTVSSTRMTKRKAPTVLTGSPHRRSPRAILLTAVVVLIIVSGSAFIGMADTGAINVAGVMEERGQTLRDEGKIDEANQISIPKNDAVRAPNGGLSGQGKSVPAPAPAPVPVAEPATLGASSTEDTSTSSEAEVVESAAVTPVTEEPEEEATTTEPVL